MYFAYQFHSDLLQRVRLAANVGRALLGLFDDAEGLGFFRRLWAACDLLSRAGLSHRRPAFGIDHTEVEGRPVAISEVAVSSTPFATLLHFRKEAADPPGEALPKVLVVAPQAGHFATLLRGTVRTLLPEHDVYITDWHNARDVPLSAGRFGFEEYIAHIIGFLEVLGPQSHLLAVCQPCVPVLAAVALMAEDNHWAQPRSMTLMAGPVDTRINPTKVNELAAGKPISWFERNLISTVPWVHDGAGRRVYPGFMQLMAFMSMNLDRHAKAHEKLYFHLVRGEQAEAQAIRSFYDEYFAVSDLSAEFYLETVDMVFQRALLAKGELTFRGRRVDPSAIRRTALLTVEGERDDICAPGQTLAAHDLCGGIKPFMKHHHLQAGAGHYGVFSGRRWESQVYPIVRNMILATN